MDIDGDELGGYLGSGSYMPTDLAAAHSVAEDVAAGNSVNGLQVNRGGGGFGQSDDTNNGADMDTMVAERRRSLANGFGLDYLSMGDEDSFTAAMVSPTFPAPRMSRGSVSVGVRTTLDEVMDMTAPVPPGMSILGFGAMSAPEMQPNMSMYSNRTGSITPRASHPSPVDSLMTSVPTSPAISIGNRLPQRSLSTAASSDMAMQGHTQSALDQSMIDRSTRSIPGMCCSRGFTFDNVTYGYPDMVPSSEQPLTLHSKQTHSQTPAPSMFGENIYSSSGFDMLDILVNITPFFKSRCWLC
jgi:hypothetical protein